VRFQDTLILPLSSPVDYPKIIKSGIDTTQPPKLPAFTGPDGTATLMHQLGRPEVLKRLLDAEGTATFAFRMKANSEKESDVYIRREGLVVELGFLFRTPAKRFIDGPSPGVRYTVGDRPPAPPYKTGPWTPEASSDAGNAWGGTAAVARDRGTGLARRLWQNFHL
ncbi:hypothetical protein DFH09DRAFT_911069, partial [Mycena vulgaris]